MTEPLVLVVPEDSAEDRLDRFLGENAPDLSRTRAKDIISGGIATEMLPCDFIDTLHIFAVGDDSFIPDLLEEKVDSIGEFRIGGTKLLIDDVKIHR